MPEVLDTGRNRGRFQVLLILCGTAVGLLLWNPGSLGFFGGATGQREKPLTVASIPYWNLASGIDTVLDNSETLATVSPWMYTIGKKGTVKLKPAASAQASHGTARLKAAGLSVVPTITNMRGDRWAYAPVHAVLYDAAIRERHITAIINLVQKHGYDGIDIDYEELRASDRDAFTNFVTELADAMHARQKVLSVDVFAKTTDVGYDERNAAQDYEAIGRVADQVRVMAYDYHWSTSGPGPIAPAAWVDEVLGYATRHIPAEKVVLGLALYGYDWSGNRGEPVTWLQVYGRGHAYDADPQWSPETDSPWLRYRDHDGESHEVWFENAYSTSVKLALAREHEIGGVYLWMFGDEDELVWQRLDEEWVKDP